MSRILIIEDDRAMPSGLRLSLRGDGHEVRIAQDGETGLRMALEPDVDLIVLDVMLPGRNGYELLKEVRKQGSTASVLMLTAKGMESDKILGLKLGADDYLSKPFGLGELLARVEALLRRRPAAPEKSTVIRFGPVEVDLDRQIVTRDGSTVDVSPQEFRVLRLFLTSNGRALSRDDILARCWGAEYEGTPRTVDNFVRSLQGKLERAVRGEIFDVAVDIRPGSATFGKWVGDRLSEENFRQIFVPPGFAHGFCVLSEVAEVEYKCTDFYDRADEIGARWDSVGIEWPIEHPLLSRKDAALPTLAVLRKSLGPDAG